MSKTGSNFEQQALNLAPGEEVLFQFDVAYQKKPGTLALTSQKLIYYDKPSSASSPLYILRSHFVVQSVNVPKKVPIRYQWKLGALTDLSNPESKQDYTFTFTSPSASDDRNLLKDAVSSILASELSKKNSSSNISNNNVNINNTALSSNGLLTNEQIMARANILSKDKSLQKLHYELVNSGTISEEEFWENRQALLTDQKLKFEQKKGQPSAWLADVRPTNQGQEIKYTLTPEIIHSIFLHHPAVHKAYLESVPDKLSEKEFWEKYFVSKYFHRNRVAGASSSHLKDDFFDKYSEDEGAGSSFTSLDNRAQEEINRLLDLTTTAEDKVEISGNKPDSTMIAGSAGSPLPLIRRFNKHSELVLKSSIAQSTLEHRKDTKKSVNYEKEIILEDLDPNQNVFTIKLDIQDQRKYYESQSSGGKTKTSVDESIEAQPELYFTAIRDWKPDLVAAADLDKNTMDAVLKKISKDIGKSKDAQGAVEQISNLDPKAYQDILSLHAQANELLRHFWSCMPLTSEDRSNRAKRMVTALQDVITKIQNFKYNDGIYIGLSVPLIKASQTAFDQITP